MLRSSLVRKRARDNSLERERGKGLLGEGRSKGKSEGDTHAGTPSTHTKTDAWHTHRRINTHPHTHICVDTFTGAHTHMLTNTKRHTNGRTHSNTCSHTF